LVHRVGDASALLTNLARERAVLHTSWAGSRCQTAPTGNMGKNSADRTDARLFPARRCSHESSDPSEPTDSEDQPDHRSPHPSGSPSPRTPPTQQPQPDIIRFPIPTRSIVHLSPGPGKSGRISRPFEAFIQPIIRRNDIQDSGFCFSSSHSTGRRVTTTASHHLLKLLCLLARLSRRMCRGRSESRPT
jgi:hypothetical protein